MKDDYLQFRIATEDKIKIKEMANKSGLSLADFIISKCNDNEYVINLLTNQLITKDSEMDSLKESSNILSKENRELRRNIQERPVIEVGAFDKCSVNGRPNINVFVDWIGYSMFIRNADNLEHDKERKEIYHEIWNKHIKPMYKEFCK